MNHIIHNISVIFIFFGIILLTINLTKSYNKCPQNKERELSQEQPEQLDQEKPSKIFNRMFDRPDVWMGYADFDTKNTNNKELPPIVQTRV
jgi:hypothetical protein